MARTHSGGQRTYDGENHLISAQNIDHTWSYYTYDLNGRRIKRKINGSETWMLYGMGGELLAEYATTNSPTTPLREYGYRNGQLLIVAESGGVSAPGPNGFSAAPYNDNGAAKVTLSWSALSGAVNYRVERAASKDGPYVFAGVSSTSSMIDNGVSPGSAYLYRVCAANGANNCTSGYSNIALGVAVIFTDPDIKGFADDPSGQTVTTIKAAHITELRSTINAVRHLVPGMPDGNWTNQTLTPQVSLINVEDVRDLRTNLDAALEQLGIDHPPYETDNTLTGYREDPLNATLIKAKHIRELRTRATSGHGASGGSAPASVHWLIADQLGTPRMVLDQSGSLAGVSRHDYLPFGEELSTFGRTTDNGYGGDSTRQKFTGYEADGETGLNFAEARYQSSVQGRFTSVDTLEESSTIADPQSFNRYSYVSNDPVNLVDPDGMVPNVPGWSDVQDGFWGKDLGDNGPHFGGPEVIGLASAHYNTQYDQPLIKVPANKDSDEPEIIKIYTFAFHSRDEALAYYRKEYGGLVYELNGRFSPTALTRARNFTAGMIDNGVGPPPIMGWSLGRLLRLGADSISGDYADENSWEYYGGSWVPDLVAAVVAPTAAVEGGGTFELPRFFRKNVAGPIPKGGSNIGTGFQALRGSFKYMKHGGHNFVHTLPHHQIEVGTRFVTRHVIGTPIWRWTRGPF